GSVPMIGQWTPIARMRAGKEVVVHGDGSSLWTLTHARDFAKGFVGLLEQSGFATTRVWTDPAGWFAVIHARVIRD
ncbi:MAG: NAD-dependent epimerase/dehydratase family protein, partial [Verrucomicrobiota bacterium]